jgi:hypothetical protein
MPAPKDSRTTPEWLILIVAKKLTFVLTTGYFALIIFLFQPRYLGLFPRMLHPHML